jgi:hypothetical protein
MATGPGEVELEKLTPELHLRLSKKVAQLTKVRVWRSRAPSANRCPRLLMHGLQPPRPGHSYCRCLLRSSGRPYSGDELRLRYSVGHGRCTHAPPWRRPSANARPSRRSARMPALPVAR